MEVGRIYPTRLELKNTGTADWRAREVAVTYRWRLPDGRTMAGATWSEPLSTDVPPGGTVTLCPSVAVPARPGAWRLEWDLTSTSGDAFTEDGRLTGGMQAISVEASRPSAGLLGLTLRIALLFTLTLAHLLLAFVLARRLVAPAAVRDDLDELSFVAMVIGVGSLQAVLHALAFTIGLSFTRGIVALAAFDAAVVIVLSVWRRPGPSAEAAGLGSGRAVSDRRRSAASAVVTFLSTAIALALVAQWVGWSSSSLAVVGADAAHYHVPNAVNLALGANPFDLAPTDHLYPMGASVLAAWFILPLQDPLLVDLAIVFPFLLTWVSIARIFRVSTGQPGLVWAPWMLLLLFSTPLFRSSLFLSADLYYMAAFLAVNAVLLEWAVTLRLGRNVWTVALASGMLLGSKITGAFSLAALLAVYGVVALIEAARTRSRPSLSIAAFVRAGLALVIVVASGGVWLIRNWWNFGSPLAPSGLSLFGLIVFPGEGFREQMNHLSVVGDMRALAGYDPLGRFVHWVNQLVGRWFLLAGIPVVLLALDVVVGFRSRCGISEAARRKLIFACASGVLCATHLLLLACAQWSSLEWTAGYSLRYALPCLALYLIVGYTCAFAESIPWWRAWPIAAPLAVAFAAVGWYVVEQGGAPGPARLTMAALAVSVLALAVGLWVVRAQRLTRTLGIGLLMAVAVLTIAGLAAPRDRSLQAKATPAFERGATCGSRAAGEASQSRGVLFEILSDERARNRPCASRRLFVTTRWDQPLDLEPPLLVNQVFNARGQALIPAILDRLEAAVRPCDYVIVSRAELDTMRGVPLLNRARARRGMRLVSELGPFAVYAPDGFIPPATAR